MLFSSRAFAMSGSSGKVHGNRRGQANEPLNKAPSLEGLEITHTLQREENFIECYRSAKKRIKFIASYSGLRYY